MRVLDLQPRPVTHPEGNGVAGTFKAPKPERLVSLDAYRGFIMLAMASAGFALTRVARNFPADETWQWLGFHADHAPWVGCAFWDLIQPSFMFMVGVALPYSVASRKARGDSPAKISLHAFIRAVVLVLLGIFLSTDSGDRQTNFSFVNVLTQIGLGYLFVYFLVGRGFVIQLAAVVLILAGYWLLFFLYPLPAPGFDYHAVGWDEHWKSLGGLFAHWDKNTNAAAAFDAWFLNLFPRAKPFAFNSGGYQTLNFVPSIATMILGLMAGELLRGSRSGLVKLVLLLVAGGLCLGLGYEAGEYVCPIVKRIWTPSWVLYSAGWTFLLLAGFYAVLDLARLRFLAFPLVVVGMNSIAIYCMAQLIKRWISDRWKTHVGPDIFNGTYGGVKWFDPVYSPVAEQAAILLVLWLICLWLYRQRIFIKV